ncbi:MAG: acetylxylan esterase [Chloroflexi bacterium]|nr:acetylxylan esterase [Chloroflexota bacterium]
MSDTNAMNETHDVRPADFEVYWDAVDRELAQYRAAPTLERLALPSDEFSTVYALRLTSIGPYRIFGYLSVPPGKGPFPGLLVAPHYGSVNHLPHLDDRQRYVTLVLMHRGQRLADQPFAAEYPGLLTLGIDNPTTYIYRGILADCLRGAEYLQSHPLVDSNRVAINGDDLSLITAARRPGFVALEAAGLLFYRLMEARQRTDAYPVEEINDYLRTYPNQPDAVARTLAYFDPIHHVANITATTLFSVGSGRLDGPEWLQPLIDACGGPVEQYTLSHEGATDHDWLDAWLAQRLGTQPKPRSWQVA